MQLLRTIKTYVADFIGLIYPQLCAACHVSLYQQEKVLCTQCLYQLPRTHFHKAPGNPIEQSFWGRVPMERAAAFFFFQKGSKYQQIIHQLKYHNRTDIGLEMGRQYAADLIAEADFTSFDFIIPVPLHPKKLHKRGYNQSEIIARGLMVYLSGSLRTDILYRKKHTDTQTRKSRFERWENVEDVFGVRHAELLENKHVLLVDDVITTGATLEGCAQALKKKCHVKISVLTLAFAPMG